ncbi:MAG: hypothetical protein V1878_09455 [bacterium]
MVRCPRCGGVLEDEGKGKVTASISGSIMGDEYTESYFLCEACQTYTVQIWRERFCGEDSVRVDGPLPKAEGDAKVELINRCPEPWNKRCRCDAHREYFGSFLD